MFVIDQSATYKWPVTVKFPKDGGQYEVKNFDVVLKRLTYSETEAQRNKIAKGEITDIQLCHAILEGWEGLLDKDNQPVPYTPSTRDALLEINLVAGAIVTAYIESIEGAKRKN